MMAPAIRYEQARALLDDAFAQVATSDIVPMRDALGRIAAEDVKSTIMLPETNNAAVDGYGVSSAFLAANPDHPFKVVGVAKAGHPLKEAIEDGQAVRLFTGAIIPKGVDCVMMQEFCAVDGTNVRFPSLMSSGKNSRPAGENLAIGERVITKGCVIGPADIGQAAAAGISSIAVFKPLRICVMSTGDELVDVASSKKKTTGEIYDSNRPMIAALIEQAGHQVIDGGIIEDNKDALADAYRRAALECDVIISSGGASGGDEDHSQAALADCGAKSLFWRVAIKPGRPVAASILDGKPVFCLPGNPVAVYVCTHLFVLPTLHKLSSGTFKPLTSLRIKAGFAVKKAPNERAEFMRVKLTLTNDGETVMLPHGRKGAGVLSSLTGADGLAELPYELGEVPEGQKLPFIML